MSRLAGFGITYEKRGIKRFIREKPEFPRKPKEKASLVPGELHMKSKKSSGFIRKSFLPEFGITYEKREIKRFIRKNLSFRGNRREKHPWFPVNYV